MKVNSFIHEGLSLRKVEVEVVLTKGLPQVKILGLPDALIKESGVRLKSAIKAQGFQWPTDQQIIVQINPSHIKKSSQGLDLAIAAAFLWETQQVLKPIGLPLLYGELTLEGEVRCPFDLDNPFTSFDGRPIYTGKTSQRLSVGTLQMRSLSELSLPVITEPQSESPEFVRPNGLEIKLDAHEALLTSIVAAGEHHTIWVGPPGTGKTTNAQIVAHSITNPSPLQFRQIQRVWNVFGRDVKWRPVIAPHHTATPISVIGGGNPPMPGELTRAHGGVMIFDELLEFPKRVQDVLRQPMESGQISISRSQGYVDFPAQFLCLATSNLCPCGHFVPKPNHRCRCRTQAIRNYLERLSGPVMDRFSIVMLKEQKDLKGDISSEEIAETVNDARAFALESRSQSFPNSMWVCPDDQKLKLKPYLPETLSKCSHRRIKSLFQVARTVADLDQSEEIKRSHLATALDITVLSSLAVSFDSFRYI